MHNNFYLLLKAEISSEQINAILKATNNTVAGYWPVLFSNLLKNGRIEGLILGGGAGGGGGAPAAAAGMVNYVVLK